MSYRKLITRNEIPNPNRLNGRIVLVGDLPNDAYIVGVPKVLQSFSDDRPNVSTTGTTIITIAFPATSLKATNDYIEYVAEFAFVSNANTKTVQYSFGGQVVGGISWTNTTSTVTQMVLIGRIYRLTATTFRGYVTCTLPTSGGTLPYTATTTDRTVSNMDTNSLNFVVALQGGASNEIFHKASQIMLVRMS